MLQSYNVMLASKSPRRHELLKMLDIDFTVAHGIEVDETYPADMPTSEVPLHIARLKADAYTTNLKPRDLVITADTVVILDDTIMGKPTDEADACRMLRALSGRTHQVVTGVVVATADRRWEFSVTSEVTFAPLTDEEITHYVTHYRPLDKAGAYGIQEWIGAIGVTGINGSFYNVMGLPVQRLYNVLKAVDEL